ncbi:MAG: selenide, water dikinase SelD [Desulfuromonas sp.]|nr:MAG: selenide, water dikinase SelD [Desulfuromonas sp.]
MAPGPLAQVLCRLPKYDDPNLLSADIPFADSGIYRISDDLAMVQSVDFFTPIVDDPIAYGRIAAANSLSDIYAVGARPVTALNLVGFPPCLDREVLTGILIGGAEKVLEAGAVVVGGHTVDDEEPKFGLAVTGLVDPAQMVTTVGARPGDRLVLTKPLGTGILATAFKGGVIEESDLQEAIAGMATLNKAAAEIMMEVGVSCCTDITGFGLLGHAQEMAEASDVCLAIDFAALPLYPRVEEMLTMALIPAGSYNNREHYLPKVVDGEKLAPERLDILADPQTSGGLLMAVAEAKTEALMTRLQGENVPCWIVGQVEEGPAGKLKIV